MPISLMAAEEASRSVIGLASATEPTLVVTPNVDYFLRWMSSSTFREIYDGASLQVLDGSPMVWLAKRAGLADPRRVAGADLFLAVAELCAADHLPLIIVGGGPGVAEEARRALQKADPALEVPFVEAPSPEQLEDPRYLDALSTRLSQHEKKVVALCLGSPKSELLFERLRVIGRGGGVYISVGAAVDFAAGTVMRAPKWVQSAGLEWVYRVYREPRRLWKRYFVGFIRFAPYAAVALVRPSAISSVHHHEKRKPQQ